MVEVRDAVQEDAQGMSAILADILTTWGSSRPRSPAHVLAHYIEDPQRVRCCVALDEAGAILGFQSLKKAGEANPYDLPIGWGIIGTYVRADAARRGVGKALFAASLEAATGAGIRTIDATIGETNTSGLRYYAAMGFETYKTAPGAISKKRAVVVKDDPQ